MANLFYQGLNVVESSVISRGQLDAFQGVLPVVHRRKEGRVHKDLYLENDS